MKQQITKLAIENAFLKLLQERPFDKISVKDIVDECGVTRNTFYYHYDDIYSIIDDIMKRKLKEAIDLIGNDDLSWGDLFASVMSFFTSNKQMTAHLFKSPKKDEVYYYIDQSFELVVAHCVDSIDVDNKLKPEDRKLLIDFYRYGLRGLIEAWVKNGMSYDLEKQLRETGAVFGEAAGNAIKKVISDMYRKERQ